MKFLIYRHYSGWLVAFRSSLRNLPHQSIRLKLSPKCNNCYSSYNRILFITEVQSSFVKKSTEQKPLCLVHLRDMGLCTYLLCKKNQGIGWSGPGLKLRPLLCFCRLLNQELYPLSYPNLYPLLSSFLIKLTSQCHSSTKPKKERKKIIKHRIWEYRWKKSRAGLP